MQDSKQWSVVVAGWQVVEGRDLQLSQCGMVPPDCPSQPGPPSLLPPVLVLSLTTRLYYPTLSRLQLPHSKYHGITACPALHSLLESNSM